MEVPVLREHVALAPFTTLGIGGAARYFAEAATENAVISALSFAQSHALPVFILGGGSNILVSDEGFEGLVLRMAITSISSSRNDGGRVVVTAGAGEEWDVLVHTSVERGLAGIECLSGIPGRVGGTPVQNVGAYGQEVAESIVAVRAIDRQTGRVVELDNAGCGFGYRRSVFNTLARDRYVVLAVSYALSPGGPPALRYADVQDFFAGRSGAPSLAEVREAVLAIRARKAMLLVPGEPDCRSAGSFFRNPVVSTAAFARIEAAARARLPGHPAPDDQVKVPAAWLIERAGFSKGHGKGRVGLSSKHVLAIVNHGGATAREVLDLMREIQARVESCFGVVLQPEPVFVGFADPIGCCG